MCARRTETEGRGRAAGTINAEMMKKRRTSRLATDQDAAFDGDERQSTGIVRYNVEAASRYQERSHRGSRGDECSTWYCYQLSKMVEQAEPRWIETLDACGLIVATTW